MSDNPFQADQTVRDRIAALDTLFGPALRAELAAVAALSPARWAQNLGGVAVAADVAAIAERFGLTGPDDVMLLGLGTAEAMARPPISDFHVGAIGLEAETGNLVLGGNVEFPGSHLGYAIHGEGFVATRAFSRGTSLRRIALGEAHPCGHCRQYLSEFAFGSDLELIDPLGHRLTLGALYPWPFDSRYLGQPGALPGAVNFPNLTPLGEAQQAAGIAPLLAAGSRSHAPYGGCPGAIMLSMADGQLVTGAAVESVAFNPTVGPLQAALIELVAHGYGFNDIVRATLGTVAGGAVDYTLSTRELLAAIAPAASLDILDWRP